MRNQIILTVALLAACAGLANAQVKAQLVIAQGMPLPGGISGSTCGALNDPYVNSLGKVGFTGAAIGGGGNFVWYDTGVVWLNSSATTHTLTGTEGTMGVSDAGGFIYSPTAAAPAGDSVWTQAGMLLTEDDSLNSILPGKFSSYNSRPRMTDSGAAIWPAGFRDAIGGTTTNRGFLRANDPSAPVFQLLILGGQVYGGLTITTAATNFAYDVSGNGNHRVHNLTATGATTADSFMYHSSTDRVIAREGSQTPALVTELYTTFRIPGVNNSGNWVIAADTNSATTSDEIIVFNNTIIMREGMSIGGSTMMGAVDAISINNRNRVAFICAGGTGSPSSLVAGPAASFIGDAHVLLSVGSQIDVDNDNVCDYAITDFEASNTIAPGLDLGDDGMVYVQVSMTPCAGGTAVEAIIGVRDVCLADFNSDGVVDFFDYLDFVDAFSANLASADFNLDGVIDFFDYLDFVDAFSSPC